MIVAVTEADLPQVMAIQRASFSRPWSTQQFREELSLRWSSVEAVKDPASGDVLAVATWWTIGDEVHVLNIATAPDRRRKGLGRMLLAHLMRRGIESGCATATLEVRPSNGSALAFYQRHGFSVVGRRSGYYQDDGEDALILARDL